MSNQSSRAAAQQRAAEMRAAQQRKDKQRKTMIATGTAFAVALVAVGGFFALSSASKKKEAEGAASEATVMQRVTTVPESAFDAAGIPEDLSGSIPQKINDGKPVMKDGKPTVTYVGALYCPFCGTHRWATAAALSRFGTFEGLTQHRSGEANIPTISFKGSTYKSEYVSFQHYETKDDKGQELEKLPADVQAAFDKYNAPPYVDAKSAGSIPWTFYGTHQQAGGPGPTQELAAMANDDAAWDKVSKEMQTGQGVFGKGIDAEANVMTAQICTLTNNKPEKVCNSKAVTEAAKLLKK